MIAAQEELSTTSATAMEEMIEHTYALGEEVDPGERRRRDLLRNFKYLHRIGYGCLEQICQVLACKYYYRPRTVYAIIHRYVETWEKEDFTEVPIKVEELMAITQKIKTPNWMDGLTRRHNSVQEMFYAWRNLGSMNFLCRILGYKFYYKPDSIRQILKEGRWK